MKVSLKICGMRDFDNIREVAALKPDFMGFIFYPKSSRFAGDDFAMPEIFPGIKKVGVFVNEKKEEILKKVKKYRLNAVQLHGNETPEITARLYDSLGLINNNIKLIKAFGIDRDFEFHKLSEYNSCSDFFLFDTKSPAHGGSGLSFDWNLLKKYQGNKPIFISGGIGLEETSKLADFLADRFIFNGIDINSKCEIKPGIKDVSKAWEIKRLIDKINES